MSPSAPARRAVLAGTAAAALLGGLLPAAATAGTVPPAEENGWVTSTMARMTLEEKVGQLFIQNVYGSDATTPDARNIPLYGVATPAEVVQKYHLGGVIYFAWTDSVQDPRPDRRPVQRPPAGLAGPGLQGPRAAADRHRPGAGRGDPDRAAGHPVPRLHGPWRGRSDR